jgi:polysaccharide export outer membrane protein
MIKKTFAFFFFTGKYQFAMLRRTTASAVVMLSLLMAFSGCETPTPTYPNVGVPKEVKSELIVLHEGDSIRISFPGAPTLNTVQAIRRDGRVTLPIIGEFKAAGMTPSDMEKELITLYGPQLQNKEVTVAVVSSAFIVYVTGAVLRPGKLTSDRPMTAMDAIMEAGVDYAKANLKKVRIIRNTNEHAEHFELNVKKVLNGEGNEQFKLAQGDIIFVPERFSWL